LKWIPAPAGVVRIVGDTGKRILAIAGFGEDLIAVTADLNTGAITTLASLPDFANGLASGKAPPAQVP